MRPWFSRVAGAIGTMALAVVTAWGGCAAPRAVGRGGPVYDVTVHSIDDRLTATKGPAGHPAATIQVGREVRRVWLAAADTWREKSPVILQADAVALREGILVELAWNNAVVHNVSEQELAAGAAVVYVPALPQPRIVELRFEAHGQMTTASGGYLAESR